MAAIVANTLVAIDVPAELPDVAGPVAPGRLLVRFASAWLHRDRDAHGFAPDELRRLDAS